MLVLLLAELEGRRVRVSRVAEEARVAPTTGLRWIESLSAAGLIVREPDETRRQLRAGAERGRRRRDARLLSGGACRLP
jgi:DNA-binding MarR family transcriptional regulator